MSSDILTVPDITKEILSYSKGEYIYNGTVCKEWYRAHGRYRTTRISKSTLSLSRIKEVDTNYLSSKTLEHASRNGNLDVMKWLKEKGCLWGTNTFDSASENGNLNNMKWLKDNGCPWGKSTFWKAARNGNLENMKWIKDNGCPWGKCTFWKAAENGNMENIKWIKEFENI